jgi:hypothetical protein
MFCSMELEVMLYDIQSDGQVDILIPFWDVYVCNRFSLKDAV